MNKYYKYVKAITFIIISLLLTSIILSILYYNNIIGTKLNNYILIFISGLSMLLTGIYLGRKVKSKGFLEGIKISLVVVILFIIISVIFKQKINLNSFIYYFILTISSTIGSMIGINKND